MDIVERALGNRACAIGPIVFVVVLLDSHRIARDFSNPSDVSSRPSIALRDASRDGLVIYTDASLARSLVPRIGITPCSALVLVVEVDTEALIDAPGDKAGALALEVVPFVGRAALALVRVIVRDGAGDLAAAATATGAAALGLHVPVGAGLDVVVGDVAAVGGFVPDAVSADDGAFALAADCDAVAFLVGFLHGVAGAGAGATVDGCAGDGVGEGAC